MVSRMIIFAEYSSTLDFHDVQRALAALDGTCVTDDGEPFKMIEATVSALANKLFPLNEEALLESILSIPTKQSRLHTETHAFSISLGQELDERLSVTRVV